MSWGCPPQLNHNQTWSTSLGKWSERENLSYICCPKTLPNLKRKTCKQYRALQMQMRILRITTGMPIFVRGAWLLQQLYQQDGGGSRLMWSVGRVAMCKAGISLSMTSNHSCSMPSAACLERLHAACLQLPSCPSSQQNEEALNLKHRHKKSTSPANFVLGICSRPQLRPHKPRWWPMKMCNPVHEETESEQQHPC